MSEEKDNPAMDDPSQAGGDTYAQVEGDPPPAEGDPPPNDYVVDPLSPPEGDPPPNAPNHGGTLEGDPPPN